MIGTFMAVAAAVGLGLADEGYRHVFLRGEENAVTRPAVRNFAKVAASNVEVRVTQLAADGKTAVFERTVQIGDMEPGVARQFAMPVETRFRPGPFKTRLSFHSANGVSGEAVAELTIAPALRKDAMPAVIWGSRGSPDSEPAELGFTHGLLHGIGWMKLPTPNSSKVDYFKRLDDALACGFKKLNQLVVTYPSGAAERNEKSPLNDRFMRRSRKGEFKVRPWGGRTPEIGQPELIEHAKKLATASAEDFGDHPAFGGVLPVSERRDTTFPSFNTEHLRYKAETGFDVPDEVLYKVWSWGACKKRFPDGIVDEDDPVIRFYKWFWNHGDGWPGYATAIADTYRETMKKYNRPDFFSFWDPAVRTPYVWGSGGNVDYLNQWVYAIPEPMNIAGPTEEMFAMVKGRPGQQVMMMTQLICYRKEIAPTNFVPRNAPEWLSRVPKANFPTIPPDVLTEAVWTMLSKPVKGVMFHGWGTISPTLVDGYRSYTCPGTRVRIGELMKGPVRELGPMLLKLGREPSEVVVHDSGITSIVDGPAQWGWRNVNALRVMNARLDPRIVFDEEIVRDGLGNAKVLYLWGAWFMTKPVLDKIRDFQSRGGIVVGEEDTLKAITPDIKLPLAKFSAPKMDTTEWNDAGGNATSQKATMAARNSRLEIAERLRMELAAKGYESKTGSSSPEIVTFNRQWEGVPYLFAINDRREFGSYVGQWGLAMEKGLPNAGTIHLRDPEGKVAAVYELSRGGEAQGVRREGDRLVVPVAYTSNDARFFAFLPEKIKSVSLDAAVSAGPGGTVDAVFSVLGESGKPVHALLPVEIRVYDNEMREIDGAGWTAAEDGVARISLPLNLDDPPGSYTVIARDRASGFEASCTVPAPKTK